MFWEVAQTADDSSHGNQAASNAILAAIAANDALCMHLAGLQPKGESHVEAARVLQAACRGTRWEAEAPRRARQLTEALGLKNAAQYEGKALTRAQVAGVMKRVERYLEWVEEVLPAD